MLWACNRQRIDAGKAVKEPGDQRSVEWLASRSAVTLQRIVHVWARWWSRNPGPPFVGHSTSGT
jgi:hypothetical protein